MNVGKLIDDLTPLYNEYKVNGDSLHPVEKIKIMWSAGKIIRLFVEKHNIAPHKLYREVYGLSEGKNNIIRNSWITREFQNRCFRIRRIFKSKKEIEKNLSNLKSFTYFREAMPFFDNPKYRFTGKEKKKLLKILNSKSTTMKTIRNIQKTKIGKKNPRTQRLHELEKEKQIFINFYNYIYRNLKLEQQDLIEIVKKENLTDKYIRSLAANSIVCVQDGLQFTKFETPDINKDSIWYQYAEVLKDFASQKNAMRIRRFRRLIPVERMARLADMLYEFVSKKNKTKIDIAYLMMQKAN